MRDGDYIFEFVMEFEKLFIVLFCLLFFWVRYMVFYVSCGVYDEVKEVAERVFGAIFVSEEVERMNVWVVYLNLENKYGILLLEEVVKKFFMCVV